MRCVHPLRAIRNRTGVTVLKRSAPWSKSEFPLPCGRCIECKLEHARQWAVRITHEQQLWDENYFLTLTYDEAHAPRSLHHPDFQAFMRRLRYHQSGVRYFMCGEYGDNTGRPHYHAAMFNLHIADHRKWNEKLTTSQWLDDLWQLGSIKIGALTFESAQYTAAYCTKKITGDKAKSHYERCDPRTGELYSLTPEYARMSLKPGLASGWLDKFSEDVFAHDHVIINGTEQKAPRYYDKRLEAQDPARLEKAKAKRKIKAMTTQGDNTPARLKAREIITHARLQQKGKTL